VKRPLAVVVGSGPTGVVAARAALRRGARVLMLDVGRTLEPDRDAVRQRMARLPPQEWTPADREILAGDPAPADDGAVTKALFGSDFAFRFDGHFELDKRGRVALTPTLARGGFSTVWGATLLPYTAADMADWPIDSGDLATHYEDVLSIMPVAAYEDELASRYPLFTADHRPHPLGPQARALLGDLRRQAVAHRAQHLTFGASRLALRAGHGGCVASGECLHGCPYGYIWSADQTLAALRTENHFEYRSDVFVLRVGDSAVDVR
jgi:choline dehydrogenase-like flavoprotein